MESSADRYLHKKFKKQLNIDSNNVEKEEKTIGCSAKGNEPSLQNCGNFGSITGVYMSDTSVANNEDNVPKLSTNNTNTFSIIESSNVVKSSISHVNIDNAVNQSEKNANVLQEDSERSKQAGELVDPQSSNSCISYVIPNSSRVEYYTPPELQFRAVNFDTRFNVSEPIPSADTSSILDNVYSKQYVTSKLVNVEKAGDTSSNSSLVNDHGTNQEECYNNSKSAETKNDNHLPELSSNEKSSAGKYICSYCNLACSKPSVLQKHIRAHTNERPYPCISCGFSFKTRSNLYKHCRSRTHANRVLGNKAQEIHNEVDVESQNKMDYAELNNSFESVHEDAMAIRIKDKPIMEERSSCIEKIGHDGKSKPYKPRFHTAKAFFNDDNSRDNQKNLEDQKVPVTVQNNRPSNSALLSLHISEVINKNNAIINSNESLLLRKRSLENNQLEITNNESLPPRHNEIIYPPQIQANDERTPEDQPLNLTNKGRKRCLSEATPEPTIQTSLIKELLLKNLYAESMQCPHCKMIFQTVTELELHKLRSCKAFIKTGARYSRSNSVNVASILTKNKNAFADIPHIQNTAFPLKSPGPFLGKTRLVESDKGKSFSFDDGLPNFQSNSNHSNDLLKTTLRYSISPLTIQHDRNKKTPVKMFGGEVKITQTSGEIKSFKIDGKDDFEKYGSNGNFPDFGSRLSENRVVKSCLQSGGTVVQNKPNYSGKQEAMRSSPEIIRVYENKSLSPNIDIVSLEKNKFNFERSLSHDLDAEQKLNSEQSADRLNFQNAANSYKYPNIMDFSQNAVKQIAPNIKQPNLTIPGLPVPNRLSFSRSSSLIFEPKHSPPKMFDAISFSRSPMENARPNVINFSEAPKPQELVEKHLENIRFAQKQIFLQQSMTQEPPSSCITSPNVYNPLHLMVNGKVVRYVPGIPGPIAAEVPTDVAYGGNNQSTSISSHVRPQKCNTRLTVTESSSYSMKSSEPRMSTGLVPKAKSSESATPPYSGLLQIDKKHLEHDRLSKSPKFSALHVNISEPTTPKFAEMKSPNIKPMEIRSPAPKNDIKPVNNLIPPSSIVGETAKKFARPNTLALKPSIAAHKQHHGLTPTMFNQILISPDTPRVAKKYMQHFLHGNYFSYLGLKSSTKPVYCTLNKTQPFYVPHHFKKLSMYSEWRQQDIKGDKLYASCYDPRQRQQKYVMAGRGTADLIVHSSYKFVVNESCSSRIEDQNKANSILGGYESNEDYTYVRGRGRGRYVCDQCGIRCKKPSMLKKHIRTHTNDRPYTCSHCNFSFKTKGNLTKHMKSKAHTKNYTASSSSSSSTQQSGTPSSESDTDDSGMDSSDESTRQQEHEAAYGLLSLSQKTTHNKTSSSPTSSNSVCSVGFNSIENRYNFMNTEQITQVNNSNFAKNKILDQVTVNFIGNKMMNEIPLSTDHGSKELLNVVQFLGRTNTSRPLTYPYTSEVMDNLEKSPSSTTKPPRIFEKHKEQFNVERRSHSLSPILERSKVSESEMSYESNHSDKYDFAEDVVQKQPKPSTTPILKVNDCVVSDSVSLKRKLSDLDEQDAVKLHKPHIEFEAMDLSMPSSAQKRSPVRYNGDSFGQQETRINHQVLDHRNSDDYQEFYNHNGDAHNANEVNFVSQDSVDEVENVVNLKTSSRYVPSNDQINVNYVYQESNPSMITTFTEIPSMDYDNSAMETLADVATKQVKLEKNTLAKSVASEYLKLATKQEGQSGEGGIREGNNFISSSKEVNEMIVKSEENKSCSICAKSFNKPSQLRLHMNIHYLERPFRCDPCSVSFRTKGHLQKHERSASHHNKLSSSPLLSSSEPRPFKCSDCNIAFRIHGHLAKHLRSKMHIMKLECLAKIPFGLYAELERANSLLTEINTTDGDQCLESLKVLAKKVFMNDPSKLNQLDVSLNNTEASDS